MHKFIYYKQEEILKSIIQNPLNLIIFWWAGWGLLSFYSLTGLYVPSGKTYLVLSLFISSLFLGGKIAKHSKLTMNHSMFIQNKDIEKKINFLFNISSSVFFVILLLLVTKAAFLMLESKNMSVYRFFAFSTPELEGMLFNSRLIENLYFLLSSPVLFFLGLCGCVDFLKKANFNKLIIAFILNGMDDIIRLSRVNLYAMIVLTLIAFTISDHKLIYLFKNKKKYIFSVFAAFLCVLYIGFQRGYSPSQQVKLFVVDYHTVGFVLFDHELKDKTSPLNSQVTYGRLSFGGLETMFTIFVRRFNKHYYSPALANAIRMASNSVKVGVENPPTIIFRGVKVYNSFYTLLYTFYSDGKFIGIALGGMGLGFLLEYFFMKWKRYGDSLDALCLMLLISIMILSIFVSQLEIMRTWIMLILFFGLKLTAKNVEKNSIK